jgi:hypothetical protein
MTARLVNEPPAQIGGDGENDHQHDGVKYILADAGCSSGLQDRAVLRVYAEGARRQW